MAKCPHCQRNEGYAVEDIRLNGRNGVSVLCCRGCDTVIHVFENNAQFFYGNAFDNVITELKQIKELLNQNSK